MGSKPLRATPYNGLEQRRGGGAFSSQFRVLGCLFPEHVQVGLSNFTEQQLVALFSRRDAKIPSFPKANQHRSPPGTSGGLRLRS